MKAPQIRYKQICYVKFILLCFLLNIVNAQSPTLKVINNNTHKIPTHGLNNPALFFQSTGTILNDEGQVVVRDHIKKLLSSFGPSYYRFPGGTVSNAIAYENMSGDIPLDRPTTINIGWTYHDKDTGKNDIYLAKVLFGIPEYIQLLTDVPTLKHIHVVNIFGSGVNLNSEHSLQNYFIHPMTYKNPDGSIGGEVKEDAYKVAKHYMQDPRMKGKELTFEFNNEGTYIHLNIKARSLYKRIHAAYLGVMQASEEFNTPVNLIVNIRDFWNDKNDSPCSVSFDPVNCQLDEDETTPESNKYPNAEKDNEAKLLLSGLAYYAINNNMQKLNISFHNYIDQIDEGTPVTEALKVDYWHGEGSYTANSSFNIFKDLIEENQGYTPKLYYTEYGTNSIKKESAKESRELSKKRRASQYGAIAKMHQLLSINKNENVEGVMFHGLTAGPSAYINYSNGVNWDGSHIDKNNFEVDSDVAEIRSVGAGVSNFLPPTENLPENGMLPLGNVYKIFKESGVINTFKDSNVLNNSNDTGYYNNHRTEAFGTHSEQTYNGDIQAGLYTTSNENEIVIIHSNRSHKDKTLDLDLSTVFNELHFAEVSETTQYYINNGLFNNENDSISHNYDYTKPIESYNIIGNENPIELSNTNRKIPLKIKKHSVGYTLIKLKDEIATPTIDISITGNIDKETTFIQDNVIYEINITNNGPDNANAIRIDALLPSGYSYNSSEISKGSYDPNTGEINIESVQNGESVQLKIFATANTVGEYTLDAKLISSLESDNNDSNNIIQIPSNIIEKDQPIIDIAITGSINKETAYIDDDVVYEFNIVNNGPDNANTIRIDALLPSGYSYNSSEISKGSYDPNTGEINIESLQNEESVQLKIFATANTVGEYTLDSKLISTVETDSNDSNNIIQIPSNIIEEDQPIIDIAITGSIDKETAYIDDDVVYELNIVNNGPNDANAISIDALLPSGYSYNSSEISKGSYNPNTGEINIESLQNEESVQLKIFTTANTVGEYTLDSKLISTIEVDRISSNNNPAIASQIIKEDEPTIDVSITALAEPASNVMIGDEVTFFIRISNKGEIKATNVKALAMLPSSYKILNHKISESATYNESNGNISIPSLDLEETILLIINASIINDNNLSYNISFTDADQIDSISENNQTTINVTVKPVDPKDQMVDLSVTTTANLENDPVLVGDQVAFNVEMKNNNEEISATNVKATVFIPLGFSFINYTITEGSSYSFKEGTINIPKLMSGKSVNLTITAEITNTNEYNFSSTITELSQTDPNTSNNFDEVEVIPEDESCIKVYKNFSPNNDGLNDYFTIRCIESYPNNSVKVYNRWGAKVFEARNYNNDWNGSTQTSSLGNNTLPTGTYYYIIDLNDGNSPVTGWLYIKSN